MVIPHTDMVAIITLTTVIGINFTVPIAILIGTTILMVIQVQVQNGAEM
jgi:hypothetical protein